MDPATPLYGPSGEATCSHGRKAQQCAETVHSATPAKAACGHGTLMPRGSAGWQDREAASKADPAHPSSQSVRTQLVRGVNPHMICAALGRQVLTYQVLKDKEKLCIMFYHVFSNTVIISVLSKSS